jgi:hypothetical protein
VSLHQPIPAVHTPPRTQPAPASTLHTAHTCTSQHPATARAQRTARNARRATHGAQRTARNARRATHLVRNVRALDHLGHRALALGELALELLVQRVEDDALAAQPVDPLAQLLVGRDRLVELDERLVQPVLEDAHLLLDGRVALLRRVDAAHHGALLQELRLHEFELRVELRAARLFGADRAREAVASLDHPRQLGGHAWLRHADDGGARLERELLL